MAGITKRASGIYSVRVMIGNDRRTISLGTRSEVRARRAKDFIQDLATSRITGELPERETKRWLSNQSPKLRKRLASVGLIDAATAEEVVSKTLGQFLRDYIDRYGPAKKSTTVTTWKQCERLLLEYFPPSTPLDAITPGDAEDFRNYLLTRTGKKCGKRKAKPLSEATVRRRCGCAKGFFAYALSKGLIAQNPFDNKKIPTTAPRSKQKQFVDVELSVRILENLPSPQWRLLFTLARWGGMRVPSEPAALRWSDIDFERRRIRFRAPKTEHHDGRDFREIPLFPEIEKALSEVDADDVLVLPSLQKITSAATRKPLIKAIRLAGAEPWPKLWTAIRATRDTELRERFPSHVVDEWLGHNDRVARNHYTQTLDEHFERALQECSHFASSMDSQGVAPSTENAKNPVQNRMVSHGDANEWALRDLNPRPPRCKRGALAN